MNLLMEDVQSTGGFSAPNKSMVDKDECLTDAETGHFSTFWTTSSGISIQRA